MTYDVQIRHSRLANSGDGFIHSFECRHMDGRSEEDVFNHIHLTSNDHIACIDSWHHQGVEPYSVDTGEMEFFSDAKRPSRTPSAGEARTG